MWSCSWASCSCSPPRISRIPRVAVSDLLLAFAVADGLLAAGVLWAAAMPWLAPVAGLTAAGTIVLDRGGRRVAAIALLLAGCFILPEAALLAARPPGAPVQDGLLITDAAASRLLRGLDPYGHDYLDDAALRAFWLPEMPVNPLLAHYVYPPGMILLAVPARAVGLSAAWLWVPALTGLALAAAFAGRSAAVVAAALSPLVLLDALYLFNDVFVVAAALLAFGFAARGRALPAGLALGAALCLKQTAAVFVPAVLLLAGNGGVRRAAIALAGAALALLVVVGPFLAWSPNAFLADTAAYFYGSGTDAFPIRGPGLPGVLLAMGAIPSRWSAFPAAVVQLPVLAVVLVAGWRRLRRGATPAGLWLWSLALAAALFLFGRTLAPNYVTLMAVLLLLAWTSALEDGAPGHAAVGRDEDGPPRQPGVEPVAG